MNRIDLDGQAAVVTGGAQGIGLAIARRLIESGAKVSLWDMSETAIEQACGVLGEAPAARLLMSPILPASPAFTPRSKPRPDRCRSSSIPPELRAAMRPLRIMTSRNGGASSRLI